MNPSTELEIKTYEAYDASYQIFLENWVSNRQVILDLMRQYLKPQENHIAVLSVGAGDGSFDLQVIQTLKEQLPDSSKVNYVAVEPNHLHRQRYKQNINPHIFNDITLKLYPHKAEDFITEENFDIIHYTHSMYYVANEAKRLVEAAMNMLKQNGFLIITLGSGKGVFSDIICKFASATGQSYTQVVSMQTIETIVNQLQLSYKVVDYLEYCDVQFCFEESNSGKMLLDFFCQGDSDILQVDARNEILDIFDNYAILDNGRKLVPLSRKTMIIFK